VALHPLTHTHTRKKVALHPFVLMDVTPLFHVCVCVYGCNATFSRLCVLMDVTPLFYACVCVFMGATPLFHVCNTHTRKKVTLHPLTHTQTRQSGVAPINTHTNVKKWRCTHKHTHTRKKVALHPLGATSLFHVCVGVNGCNATVSRLCVC
jgi:hypothetical protein